jgi:hypothetical protein
MKVMYRNQKDHSDGHFVGILTLTEYRDVEDDNVKIFHEVRNSYDDSRTYLNHTPYENITEAAFWGYSRFYASHGRFPRYGELSGGNCTNALMEAYLDD